MSESEISDIKKEFEIIENSSFTHDPGNINTFYYDFVENPFSIIYFYYFDEKLVGYLDFWITFDSATINKIAILPDFRRKGIAEKLMNKMFDDIRKECGQESFVSLEVRKSNVVAQSLYSKLGFSTYTTKVGYYSNGEDALGMGRMV